MTTESKGLIEEIIDNAMTPAKDIDVEPNEKTRTRAQADSRTARIPREKRLRGTRRGHQ